MHADYKHKYLKALYHKISSLLIMKDFENKELILTKDNPVVDGFKRNFVITKVTDVLVSSYDSSITISCREQGNIGFTISFSVSLRDCNRIKINRIFEEIMLC